MRLRKEVPGNFKNVLGSEITWFTSLLVFLYIAIFSGTGIAQTPSKQFDYTHNPTLNYDFKKLQLDLNINPDPLRLEGVAQYTVDPQIDSLQSLVLHARRLDIQKVKVRNKESEFTIRSDTLRIQFDQTAMRGSSFTITIRYRATPNFGILKDTSGTVWTSRLPRSNSNWLPVLAHPRVTFQTDLRISVPSSYSAIANGSFVKEKVVSVDKKRFRFTSEQPIPASDLSFAAGPFIKKEISFGVKTITGYFLPGTVPVERRNKLMDTAYKTLKNTEKVVQREFPYSAYHFVVLPDHYWETKSYASSVGFLYLNKDRLTSQLKRGIWAQWFGTYQREEQWTDAEAMHLYQSWLRSRMNPEKNARWIPKGQPDQSGYHFYNVFGVKHWQRWQRFYHNTGNRTFKNVVSRTVDQVLARGNGAYNWDDYARIWYQYSGQPWFNVPSIPKIEQPDTSVYRVVSYYDSGKQLLSLSFSARKNPLDELISFPLILHRSDTTFRQTVTFTGEKDSVVFNTSSMLKNITLKNEMSQPLKLKVQKPKSFWIHQLRKGKTTQKRAEAARELSAYSGEPDLQLLLNQVLKQDSSIKVRASVYATLAQVLQGASGTHETFLEALDSGHPSIQVEALRALSDYKDNSRVKRAVRRFAMKQSDEKLVDLAIRIYSQMVQNKAFKSFAREFVSSDTTSRGIPTLLEEWWKHDGKQQATQAAIDYISTDHSYAIRSQLIRQLIRNKSTNNKWLDKIPSLLQDLDPRIRYISTEALNLLTESRAQSLAKKRRAAEYDARVVEKLNAFIH